MWRKIPPFPRKYSKIRRPTIVIERPKKSWLRYFWIIGWCLVFILVYGYYIAIEVPKEYKLPKEVKKHIMKTLGKLENLAVKTSSLEEYRNLTEKEVHYLNFVGNPGAKIYISVAEDKSKDWKLRFLIIQVMASLDIALVKNSLMRIAEDNGEEMVLRQAAILALGLTKAKEVRPFLEKILKNRGVYSKELRKTAKIALGYLD